MLRRARCVDDRSPRADFAAGFRAGRPYQPTPQKPLAVHASWAEAAAWINETRESRGVPGAGSGTLDFRSFGELFGSVRISAILVSGWAVLRILAGGRPTAQKPRRGPLGVRATAKPAMDTPREHMRSGRTAAWASARRRDPRRGARRPPRSLRSPDRQKLAFSRSTKSCQLSAAASHCPVAEHTSVELTGEQQYRRPQTWAAGDRRRYLVLTRTKGRQGPAGRQASAGGARSGERRHLVPNRDHRATS
jgi:hypothetical protein